MRYYCKEEVKMLKKNCSCKSSNKIEQIQKRWLRLILNDNETDYETLCEKSSRTTMNIKTTRNLAIKIFKMINNLDQNKNI